MTNQVTLRDSWGNLAVTISVKGIVYEEGKVWLRKNERDTWELPGGRLELGEQPEQTIFREIQEELGRNITDSKLVDVFIWEKSFGTSTHIGIVTFLCETLDVVGEHEAQGEAGPAEFKLFSTEEALRLPNLPEVYKRALRKI